MSDTETIPEDVDQSLRSYVATKVSVLQARYCRDDSTAAASLARLRRAVTAAPGADSAVWEETFEGLPGGLIGRNDTPSRHEVAAHAAITLFAVHQQSKRDPMHTTGIGFGQAVQRLAAAGRNGDSAVLRRFQALSTATDFAETTYHARSLITQFRTANVQLDYGRFAEDLADLQLPSRADGVRLRWGREYYRPDRAIQKTGTNGGTGTTPTQS